MARGMIGGVLAGGLVSVIGLGATSVLAPLPDQNAPDPAALVESDQVETPPAAAPDADPAADPAPDADPEADPADGAAPATDVEPSSEPEPAPEPAPETGGTPDNAADGTQQQSGSSSPVGSLEIEAPMAPDLPDTQSIQTEEETPVTLTTEQVAPAGEAPRADTDPLDEPSVMSIEGSMQAPDAPDGAGLLAGPVEPVLPNPQSVAPSVPQTETDLTVSTTPTEPSIVVVPEDEPATDVAADVPTEAPESSEEFFVVDLGADTPAGETPQAGEDTAPSDEVTAPAAQEQIAALEQSGETPATPPRVLSLGDENSVMTQRETGVTIRRPGSEDETSATPAAATAQDINALERYAVPAGETGEQALMSIILIDDGTMSAASAALAGLPFSVTIAIDAALPDAAALAQAYRANGFEVAVMADLPEGAAPSDVEVTFESVFAELPETIALLDLGQGSLQAERDVTLQAMDILAAGGRGFISVPQGLNTAGRAAEQAGVPAADVFRDLDSNGQDARVVRRFVEQAAFRARQESGVILVGRVRPDTISALILWGTARQNDQVAVVPVSAILRGQ